MLDQVLQSNILNGVNVDALIETIGAIQEAPELARFRFSASNKWNDCGHNTTTIQDFFGCGQIDKSRAKPFRLEADEPPVLLGADRGANPVEYVLHALISCMTTSMVYHAAARGHSIDAVSSKLEGDLDLQGFLGLRDDVNKGYKEVQVVMTVQSDASERALRECISFSPVYEMISRALPVKLTMNVQS